MPAEFVALPASVVSTGPDATELIVAFRVSDRMSGVAIGVQESADEVLVRVEAAWNVPHDASCGWFPYLTHTSAVVELELPVGERRVRAVPDRRHSPSIC
ncbi:hypothetical protein [Solirubrobacter soli]|uniref:hypothetical protein n=1 Tax=Solirubrobacter soli TaxID=363832 RepID=UPI00040D7B15|nr:hypothetical protein [Solirubrobacter soli]